MNIRFLEHIVNGTTRDQIAGTVRRLMATDLGVSQDSLRDEFAWINETTPDDAGWFLRRLEDELGSKVFDNYVKLEDLARISTVSGLISYVLERIDKK